VPRREYITDVTIYQQRDHYNPSMPHAFETLTPEVVLSALEAAGVRCDGRLMALSSYENRVYLAHTEPSAADERSGAAAPEAVVVKFYRPERWSDTQILEEHAFAAQLLAAEVPLAAPLVYQGSTLHHAQGFRYSVSPRKGGRRPELESLDTLEWIGRFLARMHNVGALQPFATRPALSVQTFAAEPHEWLVRHHAIPLELQSAWEAALQEAVALISECAQGALVGLPADAPLSRLHDASDSPIAHIRLHGDCHPGNILWTPQGSTSQTAGPHFVDLDDARTGPAVQDLWMLLSGDRRQRTLQLSAVLDGYEQLRRFDRRELALIEPLRTLRLIHYSAWLARRWDDPAFPLAFPHFGTSAYWHEQVQLLQEQIHAMQEEPLQCG
jgi:Ser/Thr protein kinase RdoA (MazF antagonist)